MRSVLRLLLDGIFAIIINMLGRDQKLPLDVRAQYCGRTTRGARLSRQRFKHAARAVGPTRKRRSLMNPSEVFHVETVETCTTPGNAEQDDWCRYIVASERTRVVGRYRGSLREAKRNAESLATGINDRARTGKSPWIPRGSKRTQKAAVPRPSKP
jgi:hypothetical protein